MSRGRVYSWIPGPDPQGQGRVVRDIVQLERLQAPVDGEARLAGRFVHVHNVGAVYEPDPAGGDPWEVRLGDARPDAVGDFLFEPGRGGGRMDKVSLAEPDFRWRYAQASHFGEVNSYYHVDRMASYIGSLLDDLGAPPIPPVTVLVNAHHAATGRDGIRDGVRRLRRWVPFQGGHYRLPSSRRRSNLPPPVPHDDDELSLPGGGCRRYGIAELASVQPDGEIHLGPGWKLLREGALAQSAGGPYRANASHNAGIIYHEYGHHVTRHTADFCGNSMRRPGNQLNVKTDLDEGTCDYLAGTMMQTPHIWAFHQRHDAKHMHPRSLTSPKTMADFDSGPNADAHRNGAIWAAALWDLRREMAGNDPDAAPDLDRMVLLSLVLVGRLKGDVQPATSASLRRARGEFAVGLGCLLEADEILYAGRHLESIRRAFAHRGITTYTPVRSAF